MRILEVEQSLDIEKLAALSQFLIGRAQDTDAKKEIGLDSYINLARAQGISLTADQLRNLIQRPPLSNLIVNVEGDGATGKVVFKGGEAVTDTMTVDQARQTVDNMAKSAMHRGMKESAIPRQYLDRYRDAIWKNPNLVQKKQMIKNLIDFALSSEKDLHLAYSNALNQVQDPQFLNNMTDRVVGYYLSKQQ